jgi:3-oxoacyl-[acyl-carrier protein] reductase
LGNILAGRVAVVTGAGSGLGRADALAFAAEKARGVVNDLGTSYDGAGASNDPGDRVVEEIRRNGGEAVSNHDSVASEEGAKKIIQTALDHYGRIDILVNNAGILRIQPIWETITEDWDAVIKTHLYGTFYCTRAASIAMKQQGYGRIINTASHVGLGFAGQSTYSAAKEGIVGFSRSVARDIGKFGATCNIIRPLAAWRGSPHVDERMASNRPEDVAALVVYLASEQAGNVNGCIFEVWKGHVGIFIDPPPVEQVIWKDGNFTAAELMKALPQTLTQGKTRTNLPYPLSFRIEALKTE